MLTVYGYGFTPPAPPPKPQTPWGTYLIVGALVWWGWKQGWLDKLKEVGQMKGASRGESANQS